MKSVWNIVVQATGLGQGFTDNSNVRTLARHSKPYTRGLEPNNNLTVPMRSPGLTLRDGCCPSACLAQETFLRSCCQSAR